MNYDAKCPLCGEVFQTLNKSGEAVCPRCGKEISLSKAILYYTSFIENSFGQKVAHGEDLKRVELILNVANDLIKEEKFFEAGKKLQEALSITDTDYRIYMAMVAVKTKNYTDLEDSAHKEYLNKAIALADDSAKTEISKAYKNYYEKSKLTDKQLGETHLVEALIKKSRLEKGLKKLIPEYMAIDRRNKIFSFIFPALFVIGAVLLAVFIFATQIKWLALLGVAFFAGGYVVFRIWFTSRGKSIVFNSFLDLYDLLDRVELPGDISLEIYNRFYNICQRFEDNDPVVTISLETVKLVKTLLETNEKELKEFILNNNYFAENLPIEFYEND